MTREDLLEQRGAGTRQPDYKDRVGVPGTLIATFVEEFCIERTLSGVVNSRGSRRDPLHGFSAYGIAAPVTSKRFVELFAILEGLSERKAEVVVVLYRFWYRL